MLIIWQSWMTYNILRNFLNQFLSINFSKYFLFEKRSIQNYSLIYFAYLYV